MLQQREKKKKKRKQLTVARERKNDDDDEDRSLQVHNVNKRSSTSGKQTGLSSPFFVFPLTFFPRCGHGMGEEKAETSSTANEREEKREKKRLSSSRFPVRETFGVSTGLFRGHVSIPDQSVSKVRGRKKWPLQHGEKVLLSLFAEEEEGNWRRL